MDGTAVFTQLEEKAEKPAAPAAAGGKDAGKSGASKEDDALNKATKK
jgi:hypothetical protein